MDRLPRVPSQVSTDYAPVAPEELSVTAETEHEAEKVLAALNDHSGPTAGMQSGA